jgi:hypothetical protein
MQAKWVLRVREDDVGLPSSAYISVVPAQAKDPVF